MNSSNCKYNSSSSNIGHLTPIYSKSSTTKMKNILKILILIVLLIALMNRNTVNTSFTFDQTEYDKKWNDETDIWFGQSTALTGQTRE